MIQGQACYHAGLIQPWQGMPAGQHQMELAFIMHGVHTLRSELAQQG